MGIKKTNIQKQPLASAQLCLDPAARGTFHLWSRVPVVPMETQLNSPCLMDVGHFEENFNLFSWEISHILASSKDAAQGVQTNQPATPWTTDASSITEVSSSLVPLHQPIHSHHLKDHRICPMHFQRQLWKGQLARKKRREWFCFNKSPWRVGSPGKTKYQPGTVNSAFRDFCEVTPDTLIMGCIVPIILQGGTEKHYRAENLCKTR